MRKLRVRCLHGYHGSAKTLQMQMRPITQGLEPLAEFVCVDAPSLAIGDFGWWHAVSSDSGDTKHAGLGRSTMRYEGWPKTKDWLVSLFRQSPPFDGVFGFSQGAALTSLLVGLRNPREANAGISFDFAIMVGGFASNDALSTESTIRLALGAHFRHVGFRGPEQPLRSSCGLLQASCDPAAFRWTRRSRRPAGAAQRRHLPAGKSARCGSSCSAAFGLIASFAIRFISTRR
jgi:hypothetical protein